MVKFHDTLLTPTILIALLGACASPPRVPSSDRPPARENDRPSFLTGRDAPHQQLPVNFPSAAGFGWSCFELEAREGAEGPPIGRCYRMTQTCIDSSQYWGQYYAVAPCGDSRVRYAACMRGRARAAGDTFAICFTHLAHCEQAQAKLTKEPRDVEFISSCVVLR